MGLLKAGAGALGGVLADQWRDFFYCESLGADVLAAKGEKRTGKRSSNQKGEENIISNGSVIAVNEGQCMMIVESGKIVEFCAEPGEFVYDTSTEPSLFYGKLGEELKKTFSQIGKRFAFGGDPGKDQRIYYFNMKEIVGNKFGTPSPIPFRVIVDEALGYKLSVDLRCSGVYSYKLTDPLLFYANVCGNVEDVYERSEIDEMLRGELLNALQPALARVSAMKVSYSEIPAHTIEISNALKEVLLSEWHDRRGLEIVSLNFNTVSIPEDQRKKITEWEEAAMTQNPNTAAARLVGAQAQAMQDAAKNEGGMGAMGGFFGMNMAQSAGGANAQTLYTMGQAQAPQTPSGWTCSCGKTGNTGKFCSECGKPQETGWRCACGTVNQGKFCSECGAKKPDGEPVYQCDKCGWKPEDPKNPPKFCPECGDPFDENDKQ